MKIAGRKTMNADLLAQFTSIVRNDRSGSFMTKKRREQAFTDFLNYVSITYKKKKISNITNKHIRSYVTDRLQKGIAVKTIKTDLASIRHYLTLAGANVNITNRDLGLRNAPLEAKRGASLEEIKRALSVAPPNIHAAILLMAAFGLRENEACSLTNGQLRSAQKQNYLRIRGKGGRTRDIEISNQKQESAIDTALANIGKFNDGFNLDDDKFFVNRDRGAVLKFKRQLSRFWERNYELIKDLERPDGLSNHDLRRYSAQELYDSLRRAGKTKDEALGEVANFLGHGCKIQDGKIVGITRTDIAQNYVFCK